MRRTEQISFLINELLKEMPAYRQSAASFPDDEEDQRRLLRSLMNVRMPGVLSPDFIKVQDALLQSEATAKGIVHTADLEPVEGTQIYLWQGDITRLDADAIVNAANAEMLGCFVPCHGCIDNAIHSAAGLQLRNECSEIMKKQGHAEPTGAAKITAGYNLPSRYVIHTVGPIVQGAVTAQDHDDLCSCYLSSLKLATEKHLSSIAFCCISTGEFHYPNQAAAKAAVETVRRYLQETDHEIKVIFNVYKEIDRQIYQGLLGKDQ